MFHPIHDQPLPPGCPVIYLPGIDGTGRLLYRQTDLAHSYDLHCVSYPQDDRHTYGDLVKIATATLEKTGPGVVLAESFGGAVALMTALERPDLVRRLILPNTFAYFPRRFTIDILALAGPWLPWQPSHPATRPVRSIFFFGPGISERDRQEWWDQTSGVPMRAFGHRFTLIEKLDLRGELPKIDIPTLVFAAQNDWVVPCAAGKLLAARMPRARLKMIATGHASMIDHRVNVARWLDEEIT